MCDIRKPRKMVSHLGGRIPCYLCGKEVWQFRLVAHWGGPDHDEYGWWQTARSEEFAHWLTGGEWVSGGPKDGW